MCASIICTLHRCGVYTADDIVNNFCHIGVSFAYISVFVFIKYTLYGHVIA